MTPDKVISFTIGHIILTKMLHLKSIKYHNCQIFMQSLYIKRVNAIFQQWITRCGLVTRNAQRVTRNP